MKYQKEKLGKQSPLPLHQKHQGIRRKKDLYSENSKMLMKELKDDTNSGKIYHALGLEESIFSKWLYYQRQSTDSMQSLSNYQRYFFTELELFFFRASPVAHGRSQARDQIRAIAAGLCHSHSNVGSKLCLKPTPQLEATLDP